MTNYKIVKIPKGKSGKFRTIYVPDRNYKKDLREVLTIDFFNGRKYPMQITGFVSLRSIVTNAEQHIGYNFTLSLDLQDFFDTIDISYFSGLTEPQKDILSECFIEGEDGKKLRQGLPTSPALANIAAIPLDDAILKFIKKTFSKKEEELYDNIIYTRYADDLIFSFNKIETYKILKENIPLIVSRCRFKINPRKVKLQTAKFGYRRICGVNVGQTDIKVPKAIKKRIRTCNWLLQKYKDEHKIKTTKLKKKNAAHSLMGLEEFKKLKHPNTEKNYHREINIAKQILRKSKYPKHTNDLKLVKKAIPEMKLNNNCRITNDPVYFVGMSYFTTGWTSCMNIMGGNSCAGGVWFWNNFEGVSIAARFNDRLKSFKGIKRQTMIERCLVYETQNGKRYFGRIFPRDDSYGILASQLKLNGFEPAKFGAGETVKGKIKKELNMLYPYRDNTAIKYATYHKKANRSILTEYVKILLS